MDEIENENRSTDLPQDERRRSEISFPLDAFVRSVGVNTGVGHILLLGAGCSITSKVPSAEWCTWRWKQEIFLSNHPGIESEFQELSLASVRSRIQAWIDSQTRFPPPGAPEEYGFLAQECYPLPESRRLFFQKLVERAQPSTGYKLVALLAQHGTINSVWTTNFDRLVAKAAANFPFTTFEIGLDSAHRTARPPRTGELQCVYLHGDYRYDPLANTEPETQALDSQLRTAFIERLENAPLNCPYCQSDLVSQTDIDNSSQEAMNIACRACGAEITAEEAVERALKLNFEAESYYAVTDGGDQPLHVCPECSVEAYIFTQEEVGCAWCGEVLGKCARCGVGLTPENVAFDNHSLCSYCDHVMSRED